MNRVSAVPREEATGVSGADATEAEEELPIWVFAGIGGVAIAGLATYLIVRVWVRRKIS